MHRSTFGLVASLSLLAACDAYVGPQYPGEPLAVIRGQISSTLSTPPPEGAVVTIRWEKVASNHEPCPGGDPIEGVGDISDAPCITYVPSPDLRTRVPVSTEGFPTGFRLELLEPPPAAAMNTDPYIIGVDDGDGVAIGLIEVTPPDGELALIDSPTRGPDHPPLPIVPGVSLEHVVVYLTRDAPAGSELACLLGGPLTAGYHVVGVDRYNDEQCELDVGDESDGPLGACREECSDAGFDCYRACFDAGDESDECPDRCDAAGAGCQVDCEAALDVEGCFYPSGGEVERNAWYEQTRLVRAPQDLDTDVHVVLRDNLLATPFAFLSYGFTGVPEGYCDGPSPPAAQ